MCTFVKLYKNQHLNMSDKELKEYIIESKVPLQGIIITGGSSEAVIYKICCSDKILDRDNKRCINFSKLRLAEKTSKFIYQDLVFMDTDAEPSLMNVDTVKKIDDTFKLGNDGISELQFGKSGLTIHLPSPVSTVNLLLFVNKGDTYKVIALDKNANPQDTQEGITKEEILEINLSGNNIVMLIIKIADKAVLLQICFDNIDKKPIDIKDKIDVALPVVKSVNRDGTNVEENWNSKIIATHTRKDGSTCNVIHYKSPDSSAVFDQVSVNLFPVISSSITMISLCGIDQRSALWHSSDQDVRDELIEGLSDTDNSSNPGRPVILESNTSYRIEVNWSWQAWQSKTNQDNAPAVPSGSWETGTRQHFEFKTAAENTTIPLRQDGANEYIFDPRDLDRYLLESEPANGAIAHFTDDPIVFHFSQQHIANLLEQFGREFDIEICRTDPPPQSGGDFSLMVAPLLGELFYLGIPLEHYDAVDTRIFEALQDKPCLPDNPSGLGGVTLAGVFDLLPNVMYDADLMARKISNMLDKISVHAVNFRTSRYANPKEMIEAMGCSTDGTVAPVPPSELILNPDAMVPSNVLPKSDMEFDIAMQAMGLDTLALPIDAPRLFQIWKPSNDGSSLEMVALLLDAVEPVNRVASVINGSKVEVVDRCRFVDAQIDNVQFEIIRMTRNATRLLLVPTSTFTAPVDTNSLELHFSTNEGAITGRKFLRSIPLTIELEGF